jgi:hypothetical protein
MVSTLALGISGGVASADRWHGGPVVRGSVVVHPVGHYYGGVARRPIYMHGPVIREHYRNYYRRPGLIVEDYGVREGYAWNRGHWAWDGREWIWAPGYYQPIY